MTTVRFDQLVFESLFYLPGCLIQSTIHYHLLLIVAFSKCPYEVAESIPKGKQAT